MKIVVRDLSCTFHTTDIRVQGIIKDVCRARPNGYQFMPRFKKGRWDGYISLMRSRKTFPTGLLGDVVSALKARGYKVNIDLGPYGGAISRTVDPNCLNGIVLRDYQVEAAEQLLNAQRGIAKMATNSGKTEVAAAMLATLNPKAALFVVHRKELLHQTAERFEERLGVKVGKIGDGQDIEGDNITVAMIQTLSNVISKKATNELFHPYFKDTEVVMVDECHHASSDQMMDVLYKVPGKYRYGFSGTPLKRDVLADMKLISITGRVIYDIGNESLIEEGYSAKPTVTMHEIYSASDDDWEMDYQSAYAELIADNVKRNTRIARVAGEEANNGNIVLVLVNFIRHGEALNNIIHGSVFVSGSDSTEERQAVIQDMRDGKPGVYIASTIFDEGVDVPDVNVLILAGGGKSNVKLLQRIGRGLRKKQGDNVLHVHDFMDDTNKYLLSHTEERIDVYAEEGFEVRLPKASTSNTL